MGKDLHFYFGKWSPPELDRLILASSRIENLGERIDFLSRQFLGTEYEGSTLTGDGRPEVFVINLKKVDCFTFIDYIEAMRLSRSTEEFTENVRKVRYRAGVVSFENRNHFFTDWLEFNASFVDDATEQIGMGVSKKVTKILNEQEDGTYFLPGIRPRKREITYIPSSALDTSVMEKLGTGDYAGVYSEVKGLDVSHVGIIIRTRDAFYLRHASSAEKHMKVIDEDFKKYISDKPGVIIVRPKRYKR